MKRIAAAALVLVFLSGASSPRAGVLGVSIQDVTPELAEALGIPAEGVIIRQLSPGGPAEAANLLVGDVIVEVNRKPVADKNAFVEIVRATPAGKSLAFTVWRAGEGRYFIGVRLAGESGVASPQADDRPRPPGQAPPAVPTAVDAEEDLDSGPQAEESPISETPVPAAPDASGDLVKNGGFEQGLGLAWGSGDISGNRPWRVLQGARAFGDVVLSPAHSGSFALCLRHVTDEHEGWLGVTSQALGSLESGQRYTLSVWATGENLRAGAFRLRIVRHGQRPGIAKGLGSGQDALPVAELLLPGGSFDWQQFQTQFSAPAGSLDLEILSADRGVVYLDDVSLVRAP